MGRFVAESETAFDYPAEVVYDFVSNPSNWCRAYKGSGGTDVHHLTLPLKVGDVWLEKSDFSSGNAVLCEWTLITAQRPRHFVFQQVNKIGMAPDRSGGNDGVVPIAYRFEPKVGQGVTLFTRTITYDLPKGSKIPDEMALFSLPDKIDGYHAAIMRELD